jgi:hypothetical protein
VPPGVPKTTAGGWSFLSTVTSMVVARSVGAPSLLLMPASMLVPLVFIVPSVTPGVPGLW